MRLLKNKQYLALMALVFMAGCECLPRPRPSGQIAIASFNIEVFGQTKASKPEVMDILANIIREYDIVAIQEIRDAAGTAILALRDKVNEDGAIYNVVTGPRAGRTTSKEQYGFMFDTVAVELLPGDYTFDDDGDGNGINDVDDSTHPGDLFEREPFIAHFRTRGAQAFDFVLINIHTKPDDATAEIGHLLEVITDASNRLAESDVICLGDFNADGSYFAEETYASVFPPAQFLWLIPNTADTTLAATENTYDRAVATLSLGEDYAGQFGVLRFNEVFDFSSPTIEPSDVSPTPSGPCSSRTRTRIRDF